MNDVFAVKVLQSLHQLAHEKGNLALPDAFHWSHSVKQSTTTGTKDKNQLRDGSTSSRHNITKVIFSCRYASSFYAHSEVRYMGGISLFSWTAITITNDCLRSTKDSLRFRYYWTLEWLRYVLQTTVRWKLDSSICWTPEFLQPRNPQINIHSWAENWMENDFLSLNLYQKAAGNPDPDGIKSDI